MKQRDIERVMAAAWAALDSFSCVIEPLVPLNDAVHAADPHGAYRPGAPQPAGIDLDETQDIPLRDCPRMPREPENL